MRPKADIHHGDLASRIKQIIEACELSGHEKKFPHQLSGGMQQRTALARELVRRPRLLLLDEPFSSLDVLRRTRLNELLYKLTRESGCTTILVTHDPSEAVYVADSLLVFSEKMASPPKLRHSDLPSHRDPSIRVNPSYTNAVKWALDAMSQQ
jgi:ABC-type nitrate/sulfonate/bicarbonate transport system ATPase subunit